MDTRFTVLERRFGAPGESIYGKLWLPAGVERPRLIIFAHEVGCTHSRARPWAERLTAEGWALFAPDFRGGGAHSRSDGATTDMSVMTEAADLEAVFDEALRWDEVDAERPVLMGASLGGLVAAICAARRPRRVRAMALLYPAFNMPEATRRDWPNRSQVPESFSLRGWIRLGRRYVEDVWDYDAYAAAVSYPGPVLIFQGDADDIVYPQRTRRAAELFPNARLVMYPGAGHMFSGEYLRDAMEKTAAWLETV